jgi:hypothetical protein
MDLDAKDDDPLSAALHNVVINPQSVKEMLTEAVGKNWSKDPVRFLPCLIRTHISTRTLFYSLPESFRMSSYGRRR